jgi:hypothetical protein
VLQVCHRDVQRLLEHLSHFLKILLQFGTALLFELDEDAFDGWPEFGWDQLRGTTAQPFPILIVSGGLAHAAEVTHDLDGLFPHLGIAQQNERHLRTVAVVQNCQPPAAIKRLQGLVAELPQPVQQVVRIPDVAGRNA